ncbi:MAG: hypothetical protein AMXMBFR34_03000 [Myxococcaceae bacterium]
MLGIVLGLAASNVGEWLIHKRWLHGRGKDKKSFWAFHWHEHHRESRARDMFDAQYVKSVFTWSPQGKEALALSAGALVLVPLFPVAPFFTGTLWFRMWRYYVLHKRSHLDAAWAREHLPWHVDHHLGKDQNANWCVTHPWFDYVMQTRKPYGDDPTGALPEGAKGSLLSRMWHGLWEKPRPPTPRLRSVPRAA